MTKSALEALVDIKIEAEGMPMEAGELQSSIFWPISNISKMINESAKLNSKQVSRLRIIIIERNLFPLDISPMERMRNEFLIVEWINSCRD